jgi:hypothetical protein
LADEISIRVTRESRVVTSSSPRLLNVLKGSRQNANLVECKNFNLLHEIESQEIFEIFQKISFDFILFISETLNLAPAELPPAATRGCATQKSDIDPRP